tara:strand:- start:282 stop:416 length:135 start_codon:yes stop_codon:yes gene_type:complete
MLNSNWTKSIVRKPIDKYNPIIENFVLFMTFGHKEIFKKGHTCD